MVLLFSPFLFCTFMPVAINAEICGGTNGQPCNASALYADFASVYLAAATSNLTQGLCITLERQPDEQAVTVHYGLGNGSEIFQDEFTYTVTDAPDVINITYESDPNTTRQVQVPFADYAACFVTEFDYPFPGCRLWLSDTATSDQMTACMNGLAEVCQGSTYDTWDEELCSSTTEST